MIEGNANKTSHVGRRLRLLILVSVTLAGVCRGQQDEYTRTEILLRNVLASMSSALQFMSSEHKHINLDGVIGLRLVEGQLKVLISRMSTMRSHKLASDIMEDIAKIQNLAETISEQALPFIKEHQAKYYNSIGFIITKNFWVQDYPTSTLTAIEYQRPTVEGEVLREDQSDECLQELQHERCDVSTRCWDLMTGSGYKYYSLSHEVFYLLVGERTKCFNENMQAVMNELRNRFCYQMLHEVQSFSDDNFPYDKQDLFMEEAALCGIYGYRQFFNEDWLKTILSWQRRRSGCWGMSAQDYIHGRSKREERVLPNGCECHKTAVALGALTQYVRYTIEYMLSLSGNDYF